MSLVRRVLALSSALCFASGAARADAPPTLTIEGGPRVTYRDFHDREPTSADKKYATSAIFGAGLGMQAFPLSTAPRTLSQIGVYARGAMGFLSSRDIDVPPSQPGHEVATSFWRLGAGLLYRIPLHLGRAPFAIIVLAGAERWSFTFDMPSPPVQLTPTAGYSYARGGAEAKVRLGRAGLSADASLLLPWSIADLGDRAALTKGWGVQAGLGASWLVAPHLDLFGEARYTLFHFALPQVVPRTTAAAKVDDRYVEFCLGGRVSW